MSKKPSLLAQITSTPPTNGRNKCWVDRYGEDIRTELLELRRAFNAGELPNYSVSLLWQRCVAALRERGCDDTPGRQGFSDWMRRTE